MNRCITAMAGLTVLLVTTMASAGQISGTLREGAKPAVGVHIVVTCGVERVEAVTDKRGRYRIYVNSNGRCRFELPDRGASTSLESSTQPLRQDFSISGRNLQAR
jgi:hypothetical protein